MNIPELALRYQRLDQRAAQIRVQIARVEVALTDNLEPERLERERASAEAARRNVELRLRERERETEGRRTRLRARERELMSGRVRNPTELMKMQQEVQHLKIAVGEEEDAQLMLMEQQESLDVDLSRLTRELEAAREKAAAAAPELRQRLEQLTAELAQVEADRDATWEQIPADWQLAYRRVQGRLADPVAEVAGNQCQACHVAVTSSGMQALRRAALLQCDNCGRILVVA
ncbi:MAG TPA: C4-type zinc ribbon domain-containing protein [Candidatus Dormibacteraeota bacterium]|nr:C4-type zinc ribbon domain-containing protein [Candidatus Dormibacteraeota bacterium]